MLKKSKYFIIFIKIYCHLLTSCVAENQYPDVIATFRGPFQDQSMNLQAEKFYEENISCDLMTEPMETIRAALNQLEVLRRSYCHNPPEREPINLPIRPTGPRSSGVADSDRNNLNQSIDFFFTTSEDYSIKTTADPSVSSTTMEDNTSSTLQEIFTTKPKKKCPPEKKDQTHAGRKTFPYSFYEFHDDHENHDEYYENAYYYNGVKE